MAKNTSNSNTHGSKTVDMTYYYHIFNIVCFYLLIVTIPVGILGNLMSILIFTRRALNQRTNTGILYTILCLINIIRIVFQTVFKQWYSFIDITIRLHFESEIYIENVILQLLSWIQTLISFDRFIAVFSPIKGVRIMTKKLVLYLIILGLFIFILSVNSPFLLDIQLQVFLVIVQ